MTSMHRFGSWVVAGLLLAACGDEGPSDPAPSFQGEATDPSGDGGSADLVFASIAVVGSDIRVRAELSPAVFHPDSILVEFDLDTDELAGTGYTTPNPGHVGMGIDCLIDLGQYTPGALGARARRWQGGSFIVSATVGATTLPNGYEATIPLSACSDDGRMVYRVGAFRRFEDNGYTTRQDWLPDPPGAPIAVR